MTKSSLVKKNPDGSTEGVHPDEANPQDLPSKLTAFQAIRAKCLDCAYTPHEVLKCSCTGCPLWPYRLGRNPSAFKGAQGRNLKRGVYDGKA